MDVISKFAGSFGTDLELYELHIVCGCLFVAGIYYCPSEASSKFTRHPAIYINHKYHCLIQDIYWFPITTHIYYQIMPLQPALPKDLRIDSTRWRGPGHRPLEQIQEIEFQWQCSWFSVSACFFFPVDVCIRCQAVELEVCTVNP